MPIVSKQQLRFLYATDPQLAKKMTKRQEKKSGKGVFKKLPNKVKSKDEVNIESIEGIK